MKVITNCYTHCKSIAPWIIR